MNIIIVVLVVVVIVVVIIIILDFVNSVLRLPSILYVLIY